MLTLKEYDAAALKVISNWRKKCGYVYASDELIGRVVRYMALADWKFNPAKGLSRYQFRQMKAIYAIREYIKEKKITRNMVSLDEYYNWYTELGDYNEKAAQRVKFVMYNSGLSARENEIISIFLGGKTISQTADSLGISYEQCRRLYGAAIKKMKRLTNA